MTAPLREAARRLAEAGVASPRSDAEELLAGVLGVPRARLAVTLATGQPLAPEAAAAYDRLTRRRAAREPLQHLLGTAGFRYGELAVGPGVFVPRPETEVVAGAAIEEARRHARPVVVDLCTGSGAIALAVADEVPTAEVEAVELDRDAFGWAQRNAAARPSGSRVRLHRCDVADVTGPDGPLAARRGGVDVVVANPPYLPDSDADRLEPEVRDHDPRDALFGGPDGLAVVRTVVAVAAFLLRPGGLLVCEHDDRRAAEVRALLGPGWTGVRTGTDLAGRPRFVTARRAGPDRDADPR